jgi:fatty acid desaturase
MEEKQRLPAINVERFNRSAVCKEVVLELTVVVAFIFNVRALSLSDNPLVLVVAFLSQLLAFFQIGWMLHDCVHGSLYKNPALNLFVGRVFMSLSGVPFHFGKIHHLEHHKHLGLIEGDPETSDFSESEARRRRGGLLLAWLFQSFAGRMIFFQISMALNIYQWFANRFDEVRVARLGRLILIDVLVMAVLWGTLALWAYDHDCLLRCLLGAVVVPWLLVLGFFFVGTAPTHSWMAAYVQKDRPARDRVFFVSRSFDGHWLWRALFANSNFHLEHHLYPTVSRWDLARFARSIRPRLIRYARQEGLPTMFHPSVPLWYREYGRVRKLFNPILNDAALYLENEPFTLSEDLVPSTVSTDSTFNLTRCSITQ